MWLFLDKQQCCNCACFLYEFCNGFHSDVTVWSFGKGNGVGEDKEGENSKRLLPMEWLRTHLHIKKLENIRNINVLLLYSPYIYSNSHSEQQHCNVIKFKAIFCPAMLSPIQTEMHLFRHPCKVMSICIPFFQRPKILWQSVEFVSISSYL